MTSPENRGADADTTYVVPEYVQFVQVNDELATLSSPTATKRLRGADVPTFSEAVAVLRDGATIDRLATELDCTTVTARKLVDTLIENGFASRKSRRQFEPLDWLANRPAEVSDRLSQARVGVLAEESIPSRRVTGRFETDVLSNLSELETNDAVFDVLVSFSNGVQPNFHRRLAERCHERGVTWLPVRLVDTEIRLGPTTTPGETACYECYYRRMLASQARPQAEATQMESREQVGAHPPYFDSVYDLAWTLSHLETRAIIGDHRSVNTRGTVVYFNFTEMSTQRANVLKLPNCQICGTN